MPPTLRTKLFGTASVTALVLLAGSMILVHASATAMPDCSPSGSPSAIPSELPSGSPSGSPSDQPCPSDSPSQSGGSPSKSPRPTTGSLEGILTDAKGHPLVSASLEADELAAQAHFYTAVTDGQGHYRIDGMAPDRYQVSFHIPGTDLTQYLHRKRTRDEANPIGVSAGQVTTANDQELPTGTLTGHLRDRSGNPLPGIVDASGT